MPRKKSIEFGPPNLRKERCVTRGDKTLGMLAQNGPDTWTWTWKGQTTGLKFTGDRAYAQRLVSGVIEDAEDGIASSEPGELSSTGIRKCDKMLAALRQTQGLTLNDNVRLHDISESLHAIRRDLIKLALLQLES